MNLIALLILMQIQKRKRNSKQSSDLLQIIDENTDIKEYFERYCQKDEFVRFAVELIREAINNRMQKNKAKSKEKHYHVAYIKHNRFLSPSQKQEVTEKVTQIIPVNEKPVKIYAKPKPKTDQNNYLYQKCITQPPVNNQHKIQSESTQKICMKNTKDQDQHKKQQSQKYLSPKGRQKCQQKIKVERNKQKGKSNKKQIIQQYYSPKPKQSNFTAHAKQSNMQSNLKSALKQINQIDLPILSPRVKQNYDKVESRIKFLIDRDKQNKKVEKILQKQNKKIERLQQRQQKLLLLQYQQQKQIFRNNEINRYINQMSSSSDSEQIQQSHTHNQLHVISHQLDQINQRAQSIRDSHSHLYSNLEKMKNKTYKIGSNPVYPITSSSDDEDQER